MPTSRDLQGPSETISSIAKIASGATEWSMREIANTVSKCSSIHATAMMWTPSDSTLSKSLNPSIRRSGHQKAHSAFVAGPAANHCIRITAIPPPTSSDASGCEMQATAS